ncbi:hypothetical protein [Carboxydothermus pertinax]|uniref:Lipoprotein n=1 Tax=Carboxydothermus pertinax TaxID=870242 RepID=A0A1L8CXH0_9THEO|nr:hypothetical protein [Carboxydothermus pertinax]GAV23593.1 hypothetical protein cpu_21030 [Carboxydothermus pertinax]
MKRLGTGIILVVILLSLSGCSLLENTPLEKIINNDFIDNIAQKIKTVFNYYPQTPEELAKAFTKALKSNNLKKVSKYLPVTDTNSNPMATNYLNFGGGKDFRVSEIKSDSSGAYFLLENPNGKNDKYMILVTKFNGRFVVASMGPYDPQILTVE